MQITYNDCAEQSNLLTFTDVPNILKIKENQSGSYAIYNFSWSGNLQPTVTADSQYFVTFLGETVTNVMYAKNAKNKRFFIAADPISTAASFAAALRCCGRIAADFDIILDEEIVVLQAKTIGKKWSDMSNYLQRNIPTGNLACYGVDGTAYSPLNQAKINVDVHSGRTLDYVTTLTKYFYGDECAFDVSPVLSTFSKYGEATKYRFAMYSIGADGTYNWLTSVDSYITNGYIANQSLRYQWISQSPKILLNVDRGDNGMILYTYAPYIDFTVMATGAFSYTVSYKDSAFNELGTETINGLGTNANCMVDTYFNIPSDVFPNVYYIDVTLNNKTVRWNVIKPLRATEYYQRIYWRNEYGGIQFFDFTGARSETDSVDIETYEKNIFDYHEYTDEWDEIGEPYYEKKKIYKNNYDKTVKLTSHLMEKDGKYVFNSLMRSKKVWTTINDAGYAIIPKNIEVSENADYNNVYTAVLTYNYSDL